MKYRYIFLHAGKGLLVYWSHWHTGPPLIYSLWLDSKINADHLPARVDFLLEHQRVCKFTIWDCACFSQIQCKMTVFGYKSYGMRGERVQNSFIGRTHKILYNSSHMIYLNKQITISSQKLWHNLVLPQEYNPSKFSIRKSFFFSQLVSACFIFNIGALSALVFINNFLLILLDKNLKLKRTLHWSVWIYCYDCVCVATQFRNYYQHIDKLCAIFR